MADNDLYMTRLVLSQPGVMRLGKDLGLPLRDVDLGYLIHCQLGEIFGDQAPQPFAVRDRSGRTLEVLGYGQLPGDQLRHHADAFTEPDRHSAVDWDQFDQKPMPDSWPEDMVVGFESRVCPVVRAASETEHYSKGSEVDAFLTRITEADEGNEPTRDEVYREWFRDQIDRRGGADVERVRLKGFRLRKLIRRTHGASRSVNTLTRPDATLSGKLRVTDSESFRELLDRGVGRHRSFGFGMLLLKPA